MNEHLEINDAGLEIIRLYEGLRLNAYICPANKITIGFGATYYEDGSLIKITDSISKDRAEKLLKFHTKTIGDKIKKLLKVQLNENQFSALVCWTYNLGIANLKTSTLIRKINVNPNDLEIKEEFIKWKFANGKILQGLLKRRIVESQLYFK